MNGKQPNDFAGNYLEMGAVTVHFHSFHEPSDSFFLIQCPLLTPFLHMAMSRASNRLLNLLKLTATTNTFSWDSMSPRVTEL
jgi:hypothetical protein